MRVKVIREFYDKLTDELNKVGFELTVTDGRGSELVEAGVAEVIPEPTKKKTKKA